MIKLKDLLSEGKIRVSVPKDYQKAFDTHRKEITFKSVDDKNNAIDFLTTSNWLSADKGDYYKIDDSGNITDSTPAARALMKTYKDTYTYVLNKMKDTNY